jgi:hypothetical protein
VEDSKPRIGDKIKVRGTYGYWHYGVIVGWQQPHGFTIVHNAKGRGVMLDWLQAFLSAGEVFVEKSAAIGTELSVAQRAVSLIGSNYNLFNFNCEHMANFAHGEPVQSRQLRSTVIAAIAAAVVGGALYNNNRPRYDCYVGRYRKRSGRFSSRPFI